MKILNSINRCYQEQLSLNEALKKKVDDIIRTKRKEGWHYLSRIKSPESYALKIETGRVDNPARIEDFFACTIVVENSNEIESAYELIKSNFNLIERRPKTDDFTHKSPESFPYDDLRLYVKLKSEKGLPPESAFNNLSNVIFEIQIKTFLHHAWDIATHDLIYKGEEISWAKQRVAYQIKAMLEHAEISIHQIEKIKESVLLAKMTKKIKQLNQVKEFLMKNWQSESLPKNLIRLSESVSFLLEQLKLNSEDLQLLLDAESRENRGIHTSNLSPYFIIIQTIINQNPQKIRDFFSNENSISKIVIPNEITTNDLTLKEDKIIRF